MLEIIIIGLIIFGTVYLWRRRTGNRDPAPEKQATYVCDHCSPTDCRCERKS
jgi:hypothetical protein